MAAMKRGRARILHLAQEEYLERLLPPRDPLLAEMEALAARDEVPISDPEVGRLLEVLARAAGARRIVEVGTAIGYGALCLARAAPGARVVTIDTDPVRLAQARAFLERGGVAERVELVEAPALEALARLEPGIDLVYLDAVKREYRRYLDLVLPRLRVGGVVVADNLLWGGEVAEPRHEDSGEEDPAVAAIRAFNGYFMSHPQLRAVVLPLGDGVGVGVKTRPLVSEVGGPF
jgi:predicted O-methyltransferase YrrM